MARSATTTQPVAPPPPPTERPAKGGWSKWIRPTAVTLVLFFAGFGLGLASRSTSSLQAALNKAKGELSSANGSIANLTGRVKTAQSDGSELRALGEQLQGQIDGLQDQVGDLNAQLNARVELPNLVGNSRDEIDALADERGWDLTVKEKESAKSSGTVLSQSPKSGFLMSLGAPLTITVAKPLPPKMPNLIGKEQKDAEGLADRHGWKLTVRKEVSSQPSGTIIRQTPTPGTFMRGVVSFSVVVAKKAPQDSGGSGGGTSQSNCDSNYAGACLTAGIGDYDCAGGSGNGPNYVYGTVRVIGYDIYGLDGDGDGYGCE